MSGLNHNPIFKEETDSTNKEIWRMIESGHELSEGTVLWTNEQYAGKGMAGTTWSSEAGKNLTCSFLLRPIFLDPGKQFILNKCIAVAICKTLKDLAPGHDFLIKWPNDIYFKTKKIAGTLIENRILGKTYELCIAGIGININQLTFPDDIPNPTSLASIKGKEFDIKSCLQSLSVQVSQDYNRLKAGDQASINQQYLKHLLGFDKLMTFKKGNELFSARIEGVSEYGKLILKTNNAISEFDMKEIAYIF